MANDFRPATRRLARDNGTQFCRAETFGEQLICVDFRIRPLKEMNRPRRILLTAASVMSEFSAPARKHSDHEFARAIDRPAAS